MTSTPESQKTTEPESTEPQSTEPQSIEPQSTEPQSTEPVGPAEETTPIEAAETTPVKAETERVAGTETETAAGTETESGVGAGTGSADPAAPPTAFAAEAELAAEAEADEEDDEDEDDDDDDGYDELVVAPSGPSFADAAVAVVGLLAVVAVLLVALGLPGLKSGPHEVPIGVTGSAQIVSQVQTVFAQSEEKEFDVRTYPDEAALRKAIDDRKVYGGLSFSASAGTMFVASGASPVVAQSLDSVATSIGGGQITTQDLVPLPESDRGGSGFASIGLPLVIAGILPGLLLLFRRFRSSLSTSLGIAFAFSLLSGLAFGAILQFGFKSVDGNYLLTSLSLALGVAAIAFPLTGLGAVAGRIGVGIGAALMVLLGYPLSAISTAPEWLPGFWGTLGQALPPGAEGTLLRSAAFFDGRGSLTPLIVLAAWTLGGLVLCVIGALLNPVDTFEDDEDADEDTEETVAVTV